MKGFKPETPVALTEAEKDVIAELLKYPALEKVFDPNRLQEVVETKKRLQASLVEFERVVRRGSREDAGKAAQIIKAYQTTLDFLDELERKRKNQPK